MNKQNPTLLELKKRKASLEIELLEMLVAKDACILSTRNEVQEMRGVALDHIESKVKEAVAEILDVDPNLGGDGFLLSYRAVMYRLQEGLNMNLEALLDLSTRSGKR